jgi:Na+-translocating ferredoxin:NAD+ oxidoreductase RNF subunit RnfB/DNA-binding HxlR family transcriptional regulator
MENGIYRRLQKHLDQHAIPFPATTTGSEIRLLKALFNEAHATIALELSVIPEKVSKIHKRLKHLSVETLEKELYDMHKKGLIMRRKDRKKSGNFLYSKAPLAIGMFEFQVDKVTKEVAENFFDYEKDAYAEAVTGKKTSQMRTIPLNIRIDPEFHVGNYDDITKIIKNSPGPFAVINCICRQAKDEMGKSCQKSELRQTCIMMEDAVEFMLDISDGKEITKEETLSLITKAKKAGFVLQPENNQQPHFICCCCGCCCGVLNAAKLYDQPAKYLHSNYYAEVNADDCELCESCLDRCSMDAFDRVNNHMEINLDRCIGCGACVPTCKSKAIRLIQKEKQVIPPKNGNDMYKKILVERYGLVGTLKFMAKAMMGQKI